MRLRGLRGGDAVRRLGVEPMDAPGIIHACSVLAAGTLAAPTATIAVSSLPSRVRPNAKGRYLAGTVTLFPPAFADPLTLAWTILHELGHAAGLDESGADAFAARCLAGGSACSSSP